jgi:hypothetical protein
VFGVQRPAALEHDALGAVAFQTSVDLGKPASSVTGDQPDARQGSCHGLRNHAAGQWRIEVDRDQAQGFSQGRAAAIVILMTVRRRLWGFNFFFCGGAPVRERKSVDIVPARGLA